MSTEEDGHTLTRKQLRELRLTGSTPVVGGAEAAAAQAAPTEKSDDQRADAASADAVDRSADAATADTAAADTAAADTAAAKWNAGEPHSWSATPSTTSAAPLTRRAARAQERGRTGPVPVTPAEPQNAADEPVAAQPAVEATVVEATVIEEPAVEEAVVEELVVEAPVAEEPVIEEPVVEELIVDAPVADAAVAEDAAETDAEPDRPKVGAAFGIGVKRSPSGPGIPTAFDDLLETGSAGSHKTSSTLIFTPSPGAGSLSGPVASTGELLITGTYALPDGLGSQGHALGTTDGKDIDAVLIDGELAPASSPTPIAASSAISTSKPAGEVIRPPVPDKGSKLTLTLAIVAGGLALALAAALIIAFTTGVLV